MKELRVVVDTNVLVSILKGNPTLSPLYTAFKNDEFRLVICAEVIKELAAVLYRPRLNIDPRDIKELFRIIKFKALRVKLPAPFLDACRDPKDNSFLELAICAQAQFIITGDNDLLVLHPFRGISILPPRSFIDQLYK